MTKRRSHPVRPPWREAKGSLEVARRLEHAFAADHSDLMAGFDQLRAAMRDELDRLELSLTDEHTVYQGLVWASIVSAVGVWLHQMGLVEEDTVKDLPTVLGGLTILLAPYVPEDVRS